MAEPEAELPKEMPFTWVPGAGIISDIKGRSKCYLSDWTDGFAAHVHILAPSTYIFFASAIPALTFGEQLADETDGQINGVHVLLATSMCGLMQAILGGQPLLIVGVAEPIVLVYGYMFLVAKTYEIPFLPWASVTLFWVALFCALLAVFNTCCYIHHFTRFSGELFGLLIAVLFLQQAIKGLASEFEPPHLMAMADTRAAAEVESNAPSWLLFNGAFALFLACGLLGTSLLSVTARHWNLFNGIVRRVLADYGTALCVLVWTLVSLGPRNTPEGVPRRLVIANTFDGSDNYTILSRLDELEGWHWAAAIVPAVIIAVLFFFDHNVSSQLAQDGLHLKKPTAYHWDFMLLALMTLACGLLGLPPVNGVIPQAPMHSRANTVWRKEKKERADGTGGAAAAAAAADDEANDGAAYNIHDAIHGGRDYYIRENRVSNFLQSALCGVCLLITPTLQQIPRSVLWGFFAFMAIEGLPGNQFYKRMLLFVTDSTKLRNILDKTDHDTYLDTVPMNVIYKFTACQLGGLVICYGITWAGIVGISFPLFIMIIVPVREYIFPRFFEDKHLQELDPLDLTHKETTEERAVESISHLNPKPVRKDESMLMPTGMLLSNGAAPPPYVGSPMAAAAGAPMMMLPPHPQAFPPYVQNPYSMQQQQSPYSMQQPAFPAGMPLMMSGMA